MCVLTFADLSPDPLSVSVSWPAHGVLQGLVGLFAFAFEAWIAPFDGRLRAASSDIIAHTHQTWPVRMTKSRPSGPAPPLHVIAFQSVTNIHAYIQTYNAR